jgi:hypothetical protein
MLTIGELGPRDRCGENKPFVFSTQGFVTEVARSASMGSVVETRVIRVDPQQYDPAALDPAVQALRGGGLVGMPTDTVYGVAGNLDNAEADAAPAGVPPGSERGS